MKKIRIVAPLAMAAAAAAIGFAPIAAAAPTAATESVGSTVVQSPGNAQVTVQNRRRRGAPEVLDLADVVPPQFVAVEVVTH